MTTAIAHPASAALATLDASTLQALVTGGDCSKLNPEQRTAYYVARCEAAGLDPRAQPFAFTNLNGKLVLYALKAASDQLSAKHRVKLSILSQETVDGVRIVTCRAEAADGRYTEDLGAVPLYELKGDALANALMKAVTKAKRRTILSLCGLGGVLDEEELDTIPEAVKEPTEEEVKSLAATKPPPVEAPPPAAPQPQTPKHVLTLWSRLLLVNGKDATKTQAALARAATELWGETVPPKHLWTEEDCTTLLKISQEPTGG